MIVVYLIGVGDALKGCGVAVGLVGMELQTTHVGSS